MLIEKKILIHIAYIFIIFGLLFYIFICVWPNILGYSNSSNPQKINRGMKLIHPETKENLGFLMKGVVLYPPSITDAIDLGETMTSKILINIDNKYLEEIDTNNEKFYDELLLK